MRPEAPSNRRIDHRHGDAEHTVMGGAPPDRDEPCGRGAGHTEGHAQLQVEADAAEQLDEEVVPA